MCLKEVTGTPKKTTGLGWKVFTIRQGKIAPENRGCAPYEYNVWYGAEARAKEAGEFVPTLRTERAGDYTRPRQDYPNGFHVLLRRQDARDFVKFHNHSGRPVIVRQVEYRGAHTAGNGTAYYSGPQVIVAEIKILGPRPGGSAYTKSKKTGKQIISEHGRSVTDATASVEAAVAAE